MAAGIKKKLLLAVGSMVVTVLLAEVVVRIAVAPQGFEPFPAYQVKGQLIEHPSRSYVLNPGFSADVVRGGRTVPVRINEQGFVGPVVPSGADAPLVLAVGDSMTEGWGLGEGEAWPEQLAEILSEESGETTHVLNSGVFGYGATEMRVTAEELIEEYRPRALVAGIYVLGWDRVLNPYVLHGGYIVRSDQVPNLVVEDDGFFRSVFRKPSLQSLDAALARYLRIGSFALRALAAAMRGGGAGGGGIPKGSGAVPDAIQIERKLGPFLAELSAMKRAADEAEIPFIALLMAIQDPLGRFDGVAGDATLVRDQAETFAVVLDYCEREGIRVVNTMPLLSEKAQGKPVFMLKDDFHWSASANALAARAVADALGQ